MTIAAYDRNCDVLLSYRRSDSDFVWALAERLARDFDVRPFLDERSHQVGHDWQKAWGEALSRVPQDELDPGVGPGVVIIATPAMSEEKIGTDHVVREIVEAHRASQPESHEIPIVVLTFDSEGVEALIRRLEDTGCALDLMTLHHPRGFHHVDVDDPDDIDEETWGEICRAAARVSRSTMVRRLRRLSIQTLDWCRATHRNRLCDTDFSVPTQSADDLRTHLEDAIHDPGGRSVALVGPGGFGKTMQLALTVSRVFDRDQGLLFPVLVSPDELIDGLIGLRHKLGLGPNPDAEPLSLVEGAYAWAQERLFFIVDSLESASDFEATVQGLTKLGETASICITCRPEAWRRAQKVLSLTAADVVYTGEISARDVSKVLEGVDAQRLEGVSFLRQPIFLDIAAYLLAERSPSRSQLDEWLECPTYLLGALRDWSMGPKGGREQEDRRKARRRFLAAVARAQVEHRRFDVTLAEIAIADPTLAGPEETVAWLSEDRPLIVVISKDPTQGLRLRHDLVDSHNVAMYLLGRDDARRELLYQFDRGFDQIVFEGVAQAAHDLNHPQFVEEFLERFLVTLDNKNVPDYQPASWNMGYVIEARLDVFERDLRKLLMGGYCGDAQPPRPGDAVSTLSPPALSQAALSSIASMYTTARPLSIVDPGRELLRALVERTQQVAYRGRLVEAIAKLDDGRHVLEALGDIGRDHDVITADQPLAQYIATGLKDVAVEDPSMRSEAISLIRELIDFLEHGVEGIWRPALRVLYSHLETLVEYEAKPIEPPPITEEELLQGLSLYDVSALRRYSDWALFELYCSIAVENRLDRNIVSDEVVCALGCGRWHNHIRPRSVAMGALGKIDRPLARGILLAALTTESNDSVETTLLTSLNDQARVLVASESREIRAYGRMLRRSMAERTRRIPHASHGALEIVEILEMLDAAKGDDARIAEGYIELGRLDVQAPIRYEPNAPVPALPDWLRHDERSRDVGPQLEEKVSLCGFAMASSGGISEVTLGPSGWVAPARLHRTFHDRMEPMSQRLARVSHEHFPEGADLEHHDDRVARHVEAGARAYEAFVLAMDGHLVPPNLGVIHAIVTTSDDMVIVARRSPHSYYHPGAVGWSFEEQIQRADAAVGPVVHQVVRRGIQEEFGLDPGTDRFHVVEASVGVEWPIINPAILVNVSIDVHSAQFLKTGMTTDHELTSVAAVPVDDIKASVRRSPYGFWYGGDHTASTTQSDAARQDDLHPTSVARASLLGS